MKTMPYNVPSTLMRERELVETKIDLLIEAFSQLCTDEIDRFAKERKKLLASRKFKYSIREIEEGWKILYKESTIHVDPKTDVQWSTPFKIVNGILFHRESAYKSISYSSADKIIPQGLFDESILEEINKKW